MTTADATLDSGPETMPPAEVAAARRQLGLTQEELGRMLCTDKQSVRRWEMSPDSSTARRPPRYAVRLIRAYLTGYRPIDWPARS